MSIVGLGLRLVAARMLAGQTWAGNTILDSPVDPITAAITDETLPIAPWLALYVGDAQTEVPEKQTQGAQQTIELAIYAYLPQGQFAVPGADVTIAARDEGGAAALDLIGRQIQAAMRFGPSPWIDIWQKLVVSIESIAERPILIELEKGVQLQCREAVYTLSTVPDPAFGAPLYGGWQMLRDAMAADTGAGPLAPLLEAAITNPAGLPAWRQAQALLGASYDAVRAAGLTPQDPTQLTDAPAELEQISLVPDADA